MMNRTWCFSSLGASAAMVAAGAGLALGAAPMAGASSTSLIIPPGGAATAAPAVAKSSNPFAGYRVTDATGITSFDSTVTVPTVTCPSSGSYSGYLSSQLVGTTASGGVFVHMECAAGVRSYAAFVTFTTVTTGTKHFAVSAGNTLQVQLTVSIGKKGKTTLRAVIDNETTGVVSKKSVTYTGVAKDTIGSDVVQRVGKAAVPPFGTVAWSGATANGLTLAAAGATRYTMTETGVTLVSTSALGATGSSFTNKFHAST